MLTRLVEEWRGPARDGGPPSGAYLIFSPAQRWLLLAAFAILVVFRIPQAWVHGRFLDEEATVFLAYAWHRPWSEALFRPFAGYWNVGATATTLLVVALVRGGILSLERAPYLTMVIALAVQLLPAVLVLTGSARWLTARLAVIAALLVIAIAPATEEVFFNVLHIQFHLALCVALILALDVPPRPAVRWGYAVLLFLAPLCGPGVIVILPLVALRALLDRSVPRAWQAAAFGAGAAVQLLLFYGANPARGHLLDPGSITATMFVRLLVLPALSFGKANRIGNAIFESQMSGGTGWWWSVAATLLLFGALLLCAVRRRDPAIWLILSGLMIAVSSYGFGMIITHHADLFSVGAGERYNFLPLVLLGLALIVLAQRRGSPTRFGWGLLCALLLFTGVTRYRRPLAEIGDGPAWPSEVAAWRQDHDHPLKVWPRPFSADLSDRARTCSPVSRDLTRSTDPRYCESGWLAGVFHRPEIPK